jgi:hypothetical protein
VGTSTPNPQVRVRLTPADTVPGTGDVSGDFTVNNTGNNPVSASVAAPAGVQTGLVILNYTLTDLDGDPCSITAEYSDDGGSSWFAATSGPGGTGISGLVSSSGGTSHVFVWSAYADAVGMSTSNTTVRFRITPADTFSGIPDTTPNFTVDNTTRGPGIPIGGTQYPVQFNPSNGEDRIGDMATDGRYLYVVGQDENGGDEQWIIQKRRLEDGALVTGFGTSGSVTSNPSTAQFLNSDAPSAILLDSTHMVVAGFEETSTTTGLTGTVTVSAGSPNVAGTGTLFLSELQVDDMVIIGTERHEVQSITDNTNLTLNYNHSSGATNASCFRINQDFAWRVEKRALSDGSLEGSFGTGGVVTTANIGPAGVLNIAMDGSSLYLAGVEELTATADMRGRIEKRSLSTGILDSGFGTGGILIQNLSTTLADGFLSVVFHNGDLYLSGGHSFNMTAPGNAVAFIEKRSATTGLLDGSWATGGVFSDDASTGNDLGMGLATDGTDLFWMTTTETATPNQMQWRLIKVNLGNPAVNLAVTVSATLSNFTGPPRGKVLIAGSYLYLCGTDGLNADTLWRIEKRALSDLSLNAAFGTSGVTLLNPSDGTGGSGTNDECFSILHDSNVLFIGGYDETLSGDEQWRIEALFP